MLMNEFINGKRGCFIPKQFIENDQIKGVVSEVSGVLAEQINEEYRQNCIVHDIEENMSRLLAAQVIAE